MIQLEITFQQLMYNVTSAVIQALRQATMLYPRDDEDPQHLLENRQFFEAPMDHFLLPEARLRDIQSLNT